SPPRAFDRHRDVSRDGHDLLAAGDRGGAGAGGSAMTMGESHLASSRYLSPNPVTPYSIDLSVPRASSTILPVAYAMMESHRDMEMPHQAGRTQGGLCRGGRPGDRAPAPAGPSDLQHPEAAVPARRGGPGGCEERT